MPEYIFRCPCHEAEYSVSRSMEDAGEPAPCPECGEPGTRVYLATPDTWHCEGSHRGTYGKGNHTGDKNSALNRMWESQGWGKPPKPIQIGGPNKTGVSQR